MALKPFRFFASLGPLKSARALAEDARHAEAAGFDGVLIADHIVAMPAPLQALAVVAAASDLLRIGTLVLNQDLRNPVVLAHELLSLDALSEGRLIAGIGAGWNQPEYELAGIKFDGHGVRAARLEATLPRLKELLSGSEETFPKPIQKPRPPILIGAGGRRLLELAAREVEVVGLAPRIGMKDDPSLSAAATDEKLGWIRAAAGDRLGDIEVHSYSALSGGAEVMADPGPRLRDLSDRLRSRGVEYSVADLLESPHVFVGSADQLVEKFQAMRERWGITYISLPLNGFEAVVGKLA